MANANITQLQTDHVDASLLEIRFTHRCRDLFVRAGLEGKYLAHFIRGGGTAVVYGLTLEQADELQEALGQLRSEAKHYDKTALAALDRDLKQVLFAERTKGLLPDPKPDISNAVVMYVLAHTPSPARFNSGARAVHCYLGEVTIIEPFGFYRMRSRFGRFYSENGEQIDYRWGYKVRCTDGDHCIATAGNLLDAEGRPTHLQLIQGGGDTNIAGGIHD